MLAIERMPTSSASAVLSPFGFDGQKPVAARLLLKMYQHADIHGIFRHCILCRYRETHISPAPVFRRARPAAVGRVVMPTRKIGRATAP